MHFRFDCLIHWLCKTRVDCFWGFWWLNDCPIHFLCKRGSIANGKHCYWECLLLRVHWYWGLLLLRVFAFEGLLLLRVIADESICFWGFLLLRVFATEGFCYWGLLLLRAFASEGDCYCGFLHVGDFERCSVWEHHGIHGCFGGLRKARQIPRESWGWGGGRYKTSSWSANLTVVGGIKKPFSWTWARGLLFMGFCCLGNFCLEGWFCSRGGACEGSCLWDASTKVAKESDGVGVTGEITAFLFATRVVRNSFIHLTQWIRGTVYLQIQGGISASQLD